MAKKRRRAHSRRKTRRMSGDPSLAPSVVSGTRRRRRNKVYGSVRKHRRRVKGMSGIMGGQTGDMLMGVALGVGLAVATRIAGKKFAAGKEKIVAGANAVIGAALVMKGKKQLMKGMGMGMVAIGVYQSGLEFGVISGMEEFIQGIGEDKDTMLIEMNGVNTKELNSTNLMGTEMQQPTSIVGHEAAGDAEYLSGANMPSVVS